MNSTRSTVAEINFFKVNLAFLLLRNRHGNRSGWSTLVEADVTTAAGALLRDGFQLTVRSAIGPNDANVWLFVKLFKVDRTRRSAATMSHCVLHFLLIVSSLHPRFHETLLTMYPIMANNNTEKQKRQHHFSGP